MFDKILIANRGEIACRIMVTCARMGIATVAVYAEADADSRATRLADEAVALDGKTAAETYLDGDKIIAAAKGAGAQAIHPGYGFLSENADFARACEAAGLVFIGPGWQVIASMGDKLAAKGLARTAEVNVLPGSEVAIADMDAAAKEAASIGYPVMLKAAAGGGGKGMRVVRNTSELAEGFDAAIREAQSAFADGRVFIEKYIEQSRHIEVQILADGQGNVIHLGERECSIQRRHQKIIEEAPSPFLDDAMRAEMTGQAVALAKSVGYRSAGTVEFIVAGAGPDRGRFYFLEMNTRLQVEHPVTEMVTGVDLVEWMLRIADGASLELSQDDIGFDGWAMEARVYAEDPVRDFLPVTGRIVRYAEPTARRGSVRVDTGFGEGDEVSLYFDPMIAKLIVHGADRAGALFALRHALDRFYVRGLTHNIGFLGAIAGHRSFAAGDLATDFIDAQWPGGFAHIVPEGADLGRLIAVAAVVHGLEAARDRALGGGTEIFAGSGENWVVCLGRQAHALRVTAAGGGYLVEHDGGQAELLSDWQPGMSLFKGGIDGREVCVAIDRQGVGYRLVHGGYDLTVQVVAPHVAARLETMPEKTMPDRGKFVVAPMPGLLHSLAVEEGQALKVGEPIAVIEAMKMENLLKAERDGEVAKIHVAVGDSLAVDQVILEYS